MKARNPRKKLPSVGNEISEDVRPEIHFYRANEKPYGVFSNLLQRPITFEGQEFPTAEHAYQAGKASKKQVRDWLLSAPTPGLVAMAAHGLYTWDIVPDWSRIKFDRMRAVLRAKFSQHDDLRKILLSTGEARLVEAGTVNNAVNRTWGEVNGKGQNMLGVMLMELRAELRSEYPAAAKVSAGNRQTEKAGRPTPRSASALQREAGAATA